MAQGGPTGQPAPPALALLSGGPDMPTFYVSPDGDDGGPGTEDRPWRTVSRAVAALTAGQRAVVMQGTYHEAVVFPRSGGPGRQIVLAAYPGQSVTIDASGLRDAWRAIVIRERSDITLSGLTVTNVPCGIAVWNSERVTVERCRISNTGLSAIHVQESKDVLIDANEIERACQRGGEETITVKLFSERIEVRNNHIHHTGHEGVDVKEGARNVRVHGNRIHHVERQGLYADAWNQPTFDIEFYDNVVHDCGFGVAAASETGGLLSDVSYYNNVIYSNAGPGMIITDYNAPGSHPMDRVSFINNTVVNNGLRGGERWGGGIFLDAAEARNVVVRNNILSGNGPLQILVTKQPLSAVVESNLFDGPATQKGASFVEARPLFVDADRGDVHLAQGSPAIGAGTATGSPAADADGVPRPPGVPCDIGAYQYRPAAEASGP